MSAGDDSGLERVLAANAAHRAKVAEDLAKTMHEYVCGSWEAAGFEVKEGFRKAGFAAFDALAAEGWDLFAYPPGGWSLVT